MTVNALFITVIIGAVVLLILAAQLALYFSRNIKQMGADVSENLKQINENVTSHLKDSLKLLQDANRHIGSRLDSATRAVGDVKEHLGRLEEANQRIYEVGKNMSELQDLLRAPKIRGGIGEYILENLLVQILPRESYTLQYEFKSRERVDAAIRLGAGIVPVDAKFPLENFKRMLAASDKDEQAPLKRKFAGDIKAHIRKIAEKYIVPDEGTFDFALMYIPAENVYYETIIKDERLGEDSGIFQYAVSKRVVPVSPNSLYAYLMVIVLGLKGMAIEKSAKEIILNLARLRGDFDKFAVDFAKLGKHLDTARSNYSESEKRLIKVTDKLAAIECLENGNKKAEIAEER